MLKMKKILIVDDEPDVTITLRKVLEKNGFIVDSYENPLLALDNFKPHYYDLLILDIKMPEMNGFTFYREIKKLDGKMKVSFLQLERCIRGHILTYFLHFLPTVLFEMMYNMMKSLNDV